MTVRALECEDWAKTEQFAKILNGTYMQEKAESVVELTSIESEIGDEAKNQKPKFEFPIFKKKSKDDVSESEDEKILSAPDEIRKYKELLDDGIITEEEFEAKKKQLLGI